MHGTINIKYPHILITKISELWLTNFLPYIYCLFYSDFFKDTGVSLGWAQVIFKYSIWANYGLLKYNLFNDALSIAMLRCVKLRKIIVMRRIVKNWGEKGRAYRTINYYLGLHTEEFYYQELPEFPIQDMKLWFAGYFNSKAPEVFYSLCAACQGYVMCLKLPVVICDLWASPTQAVILYSAFGKSLCA
jgi:hypothetical protein